MASEKATAPMMLQILHCATITADLVTILLAKHVIQAVVNTDTEA
jgi:hypothetical protein